MSNYKDIKTILKGVEAPELMDCIEVEYKGIKINVYGVLHAITGGTNKEYKDFVNKTIAQSKGCKICEKSMKSMYLGLDKEVHDWHQIKSKDAFLFSFKSFVNPLYLFTLAKTIFREKTNKTSQYGKNEINIPSELSGDKRFHLLTPIERRIFSGFPLPEQYFDLNLKRRSGKEKRKIYFSDPDWNWLTYVEPYGNIPMRSIHMIEYATEYAKRNNHKEVSLFVGEIHNSDIDWFIKNKKNKTLPNMVEEQSKIIEREVISLLDKGYKLKYLSYLFFMLLGSLSSIIVWLLCFIVLSMLFN
jgi:hypothetical protein